MLRNSWIILLLMAFGAKLCAQNATLRIDEAAITAGQVSVIASGYNYSSGFGFTPSVQVRSVNGTFTENLGTRSIPVNRFTAVLYRNPRPIGTEVFLSTTNQTLLSSSTTSGAMSVRYSCPSLTSYAWEAGTYAGNLAYSMSAFAVGASFSPSTARLTVEVPGFLNTLNQLGDVEIRINDLNFYRSTGASTTRTFSYRHSVPLLMSIRSGTSTFDFSNGNTGVVAPVTNVNLVQARVTSPVQSAAVGLGTSFQEIFRGSVPTGNSSNIIGQFSITANQLKAGFLNKGTYRTTLSLEAKDQAGNYPALTVNASSNLSVVVEDLAEITVNQPTVNFVFDNAEKYTNGISINIGSHIVLSKTIPYQLSVRASAANFASGSNIIPVDILSIGPGNGQLGVNTISALSTTNQTLIGNALPAVDRNIDIRYQIPASQTQKLLNKVAGVYTANVIYTLTSQ